MDIGQRRKAYISNSGRLVVKKKDNGVYYLYDLGSKKRCFINDSLKTALMECTGEKTLDEITKNLTRKFQEEGLGEKLFEYFARLEKEGYIKFNREPDQQRIKEIGAVVSPHLDTVYLEITKSCNQRCLHCYNDALFGKNPKNLTHNELKNILDRCDEMGVIDFVITGGEPLMYDELFDILQKLNKRRIDFSLFTNGTLFNQEVVGMLKKLNPEYVAVSVDSLNEDVYKNIRGTNSLKRVLTNIELMIEQGVGVRVNASIFKGLNDEEKEISYLVSQLKEIGVGTVVIDGVMTYGRASEKYTPDLAIIEKIKRAYGPTEDVKHTDYHDSVLSMPELRKNYCGIGTSFLTISSNGDVTLCPVLSGKKFIAGNIKKDDLRVLWEHSELFQQFRDYSYREIKECSECEVSLSCLGGCKAKALNYSNTFQAPDLWSCNYFRS